jgi:hypothetical protein
MAYWLSAKDVIANNLLGVGRKQGSSVGLDFKEKRNVGVKNVIGKKNGTLSENVGGSEKRGGNIYPRGTLGLSYHQIRCVAEHIRYSVSF